tara:strand:+ start:442 stop:618 length:177 start_codon:yes stop_codon:yes gene_type:complete
MTVQELIDRLLLCRKDQLIRFYYLKDNNLNGCNLETLLETEIGLEFTIQDESEDNNND